MASGLKILYASAEVVPFAKTGGLADVAGALPKVLAQLGHDVRIVMPKYGCIDSKAHNLRPITDPFSIPHGDGSIEISIEQSDAIPHVPTYFIKNDYLYNRKSIYGQADDDHRFVAYCRGMLEMLEKLDWMPDIISCNDWHSALTTVFLKTLYADLPDFKDIGTLFTIHNLAYQGSFGQNVMDIAGLPHELFTWDKLAYWDQFNFMKAGLIYADKISTVSPTYAEEILTPEFGEGLEGVLDFRKDDLYGILNGIDYHIWNPKTDPHIKKNYSSDNLAGKAACKHALQKEMKLPASDEALLFGLVSRLSSQKGFDLLDETLSSFLENNDIQVVILGAGDKYFEEMLTRLAKRFKKKLAIAFRFDEVLAHKIYAGSDAFLMPSHYEPCGLGQMISLAYGTLPLVHAVGGLADSIREIKSPRSKGNGFVFNDYTPEALADAVHRAINCFHNKKACWEQAVQNAFACDFSWESSAIKYVKVYKEALRAVQKEKLTRLSKSA